MKQDSFTPLWATPVLAFSLSFIFSIVLAPALGLVAYQQYDFWVLWCVAMLILALPFTYLEIALSKRAKVSPLQGFMQLTRDADSHVRWRLIAWGAALLVPFISGAILSFSTNQISQQFQFGFPVQVIFLLLVIMAFALTFLPRLLLLLLAIITSIICIALSLFSNESSQWQWTAIEFGEWAKVVILSLVTCGLGLGIYWQNAISSEKQQSATPIVLPIWVAQALGLAAFALINATYSILQVVSLTVAAVSLVAVLLQLIRQQLIDRQLSIVIQLIVLLVPILIWAIPNIQSIFFLLIISTGLLLGLAYAVFAGWLMKISHLRKAMNFDSEIAYNIWRISIRIVAPVAIILAIIGWVILLLGV